MMKRWTALVVGAIGLVAAASAQEGSRPASSTDTQVRDRLASNVTRTAPSGTIEEAAQVGSANGAPTEPRVGPKGGSGSKITTEITLDYASKYVWHGLNLVNDGVFQPGVASTYGNLTLSFWASMELTDWNAPNYGRDPDGHFTEVDTSLSYAGTLRGLGWSIGFADYQYPRTGSRRYREWIAGVTREESWGVASIEVHSNVDDLTGTYVTLGLSGSVPAPIGTAHTIDLGLETTFGDVRCNRFLYGYDTAAFTDVGATAGTVFEIGRGWNLGVTLHASTLLAPDLMRGQPRRSNVWTSLSLATAF